MKRFLLLLAGLMLLASPAAAVDYLVHDQDGHGTTKCEFSQAVQVNIAGLDYQPGDRTFMCLAPISTVRHSGNRGWTPRAADAPGPVAPSPEPVDPGPIDPDPVDPDPVDPDPVDPDPVDPDPVDPDPVDPDPVDPGDCLRVSDCPNEPDPKPEPEPTPGDDCGNKGRPCNPNNPGNGNGNGNPPCPPNNKHCR